MFFFVNINQVYFVWNVFSRQRNIFLSDFSKKTHQPNLRCFNLNIDKPAEQWPNSAWQTQKGNSVIYVTR